MKKLILAAAASIGLSGCVGFGGYGSGISVGYGSGYGSNYGYNNGYGYSGYGGNDCIAYDRFGRAYYQCGYGNYYGSNRYTYSPRTVVYYYPGYTYRRGSYYDGYNRRYDSGTLYNRHYRRQYRRY